MLKLTLRGIAASKGRLLLTMISIFLGVAVVSGAFVVTDTLRSTFDDLSEDIFAGVDVVVRAEEPEVNSSFDDPRFDESVASLIGDVPGVESFEPGIGSVERVFAIDADGEAVRPPQGPPVIAVGWLGPSDLSSLSLVDGVAPAGDGQVGLDPIQMEEGGFELGDMVPIATPDGVEEFELVGSIEFGTPGPYFIVFDLPTAQRVFQEPGRIDSIVIGAEPGYDIAALVADVSAVLPSGVEAVSSSVAVNETQEEFGSSLSILGNILLGFAGVILFVSIFIIYNTFAILVSQRTKQTGLLRAIGASSNQVLSMVLLEAIVVGLVASIVGLFGGLGIAKLLLNLFTSGGSFDTGPLELKPRTIMVVILVGLVVTVISAILPALRAARVSPLEALYDTHSDQRSLRSRIIAGSAVLVPGIIVLALGLAGTTGTTSGILTLLGVGSVLTFIGVAMLSALFAGPVASVIGRPIEAMRGTVGRIARDNASRNPQRTAATATALMIGLSLITAVTVLASSIKSAFSDLLEEALAADIFIFEPNQGLAFSPALVDDLNVLDEVGQVAGYVELSGLVDGDKEAISAFDDGVGAELIAIKMVDGVAAVGSDGIAVREGKAEDLGLAVGDQVTVAFDDGEPLDLTVKGIFEPSGALEGNWYVDRATAGPHLTVDSVEFLAVNLSDDFSAEAGLAAVTDASAAYPQVDVQTNEEFQKEAEGQINSLLLFINGILALCLLIAFFGIVNTMALSVLERTKEIGLLRAVGMTRRQLRSSIRWEAVIVSVFGSLLGVGMGVILATAGISALPEGFIDGPTIPYATMIAYVVAGGVLGVVAAFFPARRAAKLNVLDAIAST